MSLEQPDLVFGESFLWNLYRQKGQRPYQEDKLSSAELKYSFWHSVKVLLYFVKHDRAARWQWLKHRWEALCLWTGDAVMAAHESLDPMHGEYKQAGRALCTAVWFWVFIGVWHHFLPSLPLCFFFLYYFGSFFFFLCLLTSATEAISNYLSRQNSKQVEGAREGKVFSWINSIFLNKTSLSVWKCWLWMQPDLACFQGSA